MTYRSNRPVLTALGLLVLSAHATAQVPDSAAVAAMARQPASVLPFDPRATMRTLPNGLRYYIRSNAKPEKRVELRLVVNVGSIVEDDDQLGLAHVLEHMAFNGTRTFAKQQIVDFIERAGMTFGADLNAGTSFDETMYELRVPSDTGNYVARALDWFADIASGGITLDSLEVEKERPVVVEEWRLGKGASERMQQKQFPVLFRDSRYASRWPIGTKESLDRFTRAALLRLYRDWYRPDLMAVVVVGDIPVDSVDAMIRARFSRIPAASPTARSRDVATVPSHAETLVSVATDPEAAESNVGVVWKQPPVKRTTVRDFQRDIAEGLFLAMLNRRFSEIVRKPNAPFVDAGVGQGRLVRAAESFSLSAIVQDGGIEKGLAAALTEAERVRKHGFTETEFAREKSNLLRSNDIQYAERDRTESATFAARYADHFLTGDPVLGIEVRSMLARAVLPTITVPQINALANDWLVERNRVILATAPQKTGASAPSEGALRTVLTRARTANVAPYVDVVASAPLVAARPAPGTIVSERTIDAIGVTEWTLSNGIRVLIKPTDFQADQVLISGVSIGGVGGLTADRYYSALLGPLLLERGGAGTIDAVSLTKLMDGKAAAVSANIDDRSESVSGQAAPRDLETFFELMWARVLTPRVDTAAVTALKQQYLGFIRNRANEPTAVFSDTVSQTMSQRHPHAQPITERLVQSLDANVAVEVFRDRFRDFSDFTFVIVGAVQPAQLRPFVEQWIAALPGGGRRETPRSPGIEPPPGIVAKVVRKGIEPKAQVTVILTGRAEWSRDAALRAGAISEILMMRLRESLRENLGGTYGVGAGTSIERWPGGRFSTSYTFGSSPERIDSLAQVALEELRKFAASGPTPEELAKVKESFMRNRETALKENDFWMGTLQIQAMWGDDAVDAVQSYAARVAALDAESLRSLAKVLFDETNYARFTLIPERR
jgi:zinc protease